MSRLFALSVVAGLVGLSLPAGGADVPAQTEAINKYIAQGWEKAGIRRPAARATDLEFCRRVFLDLDCDVFDPAFFPAVTQPVPFGLGPAQVLRVLDAVWSERVVGLAVSEFDPGRDRNDMSLAALMWLIEHLLLRRYEKRAAN